MTMYICINDKLNFAGIELDKVDSLAEFFRLDYKATHLVLIPPTMATMLESLSTEFLESSVVELNLVLVTSRDEWLRAAGLSGIPSMPIDEFVREIRRVERSHGSKEEGDSSDAEHDVSAQNVDGPLDAAQLGVGINL